MGGIVVVCVAFGLTVSEVKTELMCLLRAKWMPASTATFSVEAAGQVYNQTNECVYLGGSVNHNVAQRYLVTLLTRFDPGKRDFSHSKTKKTKIKMPNGWRTIKSLVHKIRLHGRRGKGMAESFSREKLRHASQKEGG